MLARLLARRLVRADCSTRACQRFSTSASSPSALIVAALATVSVSVELLAASAWKFSSASRRCARWLASDTPISTGMASAVTSTERRADREGGDQEEHDEQQVDRQHRHLAGEEAAQHVELAQPLGDDARRRALEMPVGQAPSGDAAPRRSSARRGARRSWPTASRARHAGRNRRHRLRACPRRAPSSPTRGRRADGAPITALTTSIMKSGVRSPSRLMSERRGGELEDDRPHARPERRIPLLGRTRARAAGAATARASPGRAPPAPSLARRGPRRRRARSSRWRDPRRRHGQRHRGPNDGEGKRQLIERAGREIDRLAVEAEPHRRRQEGSFVETGRREPPRDGGHRLR